MGMAGIDTGYFRIELCLCIIVLELYPITVFVNLADFRVHCFSLFKRASSILVKDQEAK